MDGRKPGTDRAQDLTAATSYIWENRDGETGSAEEIWRVALPRQPLIHGSHN